MKQFRALGSCWLLWAGLTAGIATAQPPTEFHLESPTIVELELSDGSRRLVMLSDLTAAKATFRALDSATGMAVGPPKTLDSSTIRSIRPLGRRFVRHLESGKFRIDDGSTRAIGVEPSTPGKRPPDGVRRKWAILIGIDQYSDKTIRPLQYCGADVRRVAEVLTSVAGYDASHVMTLTDAQATLAVLNRTIPGLLSQVSPVDTVVVYFSGHGFLVDGKGYLTAADTYKAQLAKTALATAQLRKWLLDCPARERLLMLDCCHAAGRAVEQAEPSAKDLAEEFRQGQNLLTFASCQADEQSREWAERKHGLFSYYLAEGLTGAADADVNGIVDSDELFKFIAEGVRKTAGRFEWKQTPARIVAGSGEVPIYTLANVPRRRYDVDFAKITDGKLPEGWQAAPGTVRVSRGGSGLVQLEPDVRGVHLVRLPNEIAALMKNDFAVVTEFGAPIQVNGDGWKEWFEIRLHARGGGDVVVGSYTAGGSIFIAGERPSSRQNRTFFPNPVQLTLKRNAGVVQVTARNTQGEDILFRNFQVGNSAFEGITIAVKRNGSARADSSSLHSISVIPIRE